MDELSVDLNMTNNPIFNFSQSKADIEKNSRQTITNEESLNRYKIVEDNIQQIKDKTFNLLDRDELCMLKFQDRITNDGCHNNKPNSKKISMSVSNDLDNSNSIPFENLVDNSMNSLFDMKTIRNFKNTNSTLSQSFPICKENMIQNLEVKLNHNAIPGQNLDEAFSNLIKEYLNIEYFPSERKQKALLLKKFSSIYKKIKFDKTKMNNFVAKLAIRINEGFDDIITLLDFEILRNKKEASFTNFWKNFKKFVQILLEKNILNICEINTTSEIKIELVEQIEKRINEYIISYENIIKFLKDSEKNSSIIERFQINFKLSKFIKEEGKGKILKKIKESFDKNHIFYYDLILEQIFLKNQKDKINTHLHQNSFVNYVPNFDKHKITHNNQNLVLIHTHEYFYISSKERNLNINKRNEKASLSENLNDICNISTDKNFSEKQFQLKNLKDCLSSSNLNEIQDEILNPVWSNRYFLKIYNSQDFHHN